MKGGTCYWGGCYINIIPAGLHFVNLVMVQMTALKIVAIYFPLVGDLFYVVVMVLDTTFSEIHEILMPKQPTK